MMDLIKLMEEHRPTTILELGELVENLKKPENLINIKNFYIS